MRHPSQEQLLAFVGGDAPPADAEHLYAHTAECGVCQERVQVLRSLRADFDGAWDRFVAEARHRLARPVAQEATAVVFHGILDGARRLATAALQTLSGASPLRAAFVPVYSGVGDAERGPEAGRLAEEASRLLGAGEPAEALDRLAQVARTAPQVAASARLDLLAADQLAARVVVDADRRAVSVLVYPSAGTFPAGAAILAASELPGAPPRRRAFEPVEGASYLLAEFEEVPDGPFTLRLEVSGRS